MSTIQVDLLLKELADIVSLQTTKPLPQAHMIQHSKALTLACGIHKIKKLLAAGIRYEQEKVAATGHNQSIT